MAVRCTMYFHETPYRGIYTLRPPDLHPIPFSTYSPLPHLCYSSFIQLTRVNGDPDNANINNIASIICGM